MYTIKFPSCFLWVLDHSCDCISSYYRRLLKKFLYYFLVMSNFVITVTLCNNILSHFVHLSHFVITTCHTLLHFEMRIMSKNLCNLVVTLCNKIIISIYLPVYLDYISTSTRLMATILDMLVSLSKRQLPTKSRDPLISWSGRHVANEKRFISISKNFMTIKLDREVASDEKMLSTKSHNPLITWIKLSDHQITWQIKIIIFSFLWDLWSLN